MSCLQEDDTSIIYFFDDDSEYVSPQDSRHLLYEHADSQSSSSTTDVVSYTFGSWHCRQCNIAVKRRKNGPTEASPIRLCSVCAILMACLNQFDNYPPVEEILDNTFLDRQLKLNYDTRNHCVQHVHTKVYTCERCLGHKQYMNPFKYCIQCFANEWPNSCNKQLVIARSGNLSLVRVEAVLPYLRRRTELKDQRRSTQGQLRYAMGSDYRYWEFMMGRDVVSVSCNINGQYTVVPLAPDAVCPMDQQDVDAVRNVEAKRIAVVSEEHQLIPNIAKMIVDMESLQAGCNADGSVRR